jgi:hypothetical protein
MDQKVIRLVEKIISETDLITEIKRVDKEYYFMFRGRFFSVSQDKATNFHKLYVYPKWDQDLSSLINSFEFGLIEDDVFVSFLPGDAGEEDLMSSLYEAIKRKYSNIDEFLDDILSDDIPF